jgi:Transmembrane protein 43
MSDTHVEYSHRGYFSRLGGAIKGVVFGAILFVVSFGVLFWNEGRAVKRTRALNETAANTVPVDARAISADNEGKPVHFSGDATGEKLTDPKFGVTREAIHLHRVVEMYQWDEDVRRETKKDAVGGGTTTKTTYTYKKVWHDRPIDSNRFKHSSGHENPAAMRVQGEKWVAKQVDVGAFRLPASLVSEIDNFRPLPVDRAMLDSLPVGLRQGTIVADGRFYLPNKFGSRVRVDPGNPQVGDLRVAFKGVPPGPVSVVAKQTGGTLEPFQTASGPVAILYVGTHTPDAMFKSEHNKNTVLTWVLRLAGFAVMWIGLVTALKPLTVMADVVGIVGDIAEAGVGLVTGLVALVLSLSTIAVAWLFYRPVLGIGLLSIAAGGVWWFTRLRAKGHAQFEAHRQQGTAGGPGPHAMPAVPLPPVPTAPSKAA